MLSKTEFRTKYKKNYSVKTNLADSTFILQSVGLRNALDAMVECALWARYRMHLKLAILISNSTIITDRSIILWSVSLRNASDAMVEYALWALYCMYLKLAIKLSNSTVDQRCRPTVERRSGG